MTPVELVRQRFDMPHAPRVYQAPEINILAETPRAGFYWEPGVGKTLGSTYWALYWTAVGNIEVWLVIMPPILIDQWEEWLVSCKHAGSGAPLKAVMYKGTPKQRAAIDLSRAEFILVSYEIFKRDFDHLLAAVQGRKFGGMCDEATAIKNIETDSHRAVHMFFEEAPLALLTGTPVNKPLDGYGYIRLIAPGVYRNKRQFEKLHVESYDEYENAEEYKNLELLAQNMKINSSRIIAREVRKDMPPCQIALVPYSLDDEHLKLYRRVASERLVELENAVIDAVSSGKLRMALQQIIINWSTFAGKEDLRPKGLDLVEEILEEIGDRKLVVAGYFQRTNTYLLEALKQFGAVAIYGLSTDKTKAEAKRRFINDKSCRVIILQPGAGGIGVDGLQHVCSDMLILEAPTRPDHFWQVIKRLDRDGQSLPVNVRIAVAKGTVQTRLFRNLMDNDALANKVQGGYQDLKESIYGG